MPTVLNLGSVNLDHVYRVPHFVQPGETLASSRYRVGFGGKGFNQSIALARAGCRVIHAGAVGPDGSALVRRLIAEKVAVERIIQADVSTGHAIIQVDDEGQNAIVLFPGANGHIRPMHLGSFFSGLGTGDHFLCQNETAAVPEAILYAKGAGLTVWFNPAPMSPDVLGYPLEAVEWLVVNETEGAALSGTHAPECIVETLRARWPALRVVLTLGAEGVLVAADGELLRLPAVRIQTVDTTAAGDTFIGFFMAGILDGRSPREAADRAIRAAALSVTRPGAADSIPRASELRDASHPNETPPAQGP